jgi:flotillin
VVARFPSKVNKVTFSTEQVTKEMQGVKVSGMLVWSIRRDAEGPMMAYKNLGDDLCSGNPKTANDNLISMASAIVRAAIANASINEMLKNREALRMSIRDDLTKVVKGWGVWLETVEITDVQIMSNALFKDLQANYRETKKKDAEVYRMKIESELNSLRTEKELALKEITDAYAADLAHYKDKINFDCNSMEAANDEETNKIQLKINELIQNFSLKKVEIREVHETHSRKFD